MATGFLYRGLWQSYSDFLNSDNEYNTEISDCFDSNWALIEVNTLLTIFGPPWEVENLQKSPKEICHHFRLWDYLDKFMYECFIFKHYARALTVSVTVETNADKSRVNDVLEFCNEVNSKDLIHQVALVHDITTDKLCLRVIRQFLFTPSVASVTLSEGLRDLKGYALKLAAFEKPKANAWKKYAAYREFEPFKTAEDFWFEHDDKYDALSTFARRSKIIYENEDIRVHSMINVGVLGGLGTKCFLEGHITTYKEFPHLAVMNTYVDTPSYSKDSGKALYYANQWNAGVHFAPFRVVVMQEEGKVQHLLMLMSGVFADKVNCYTYIDFLCTLHKITEKANRDLLYFDQIPQIELPEVAKFTN